jgi:hypothetical protein
MDDDYLIGKLRDLCRRFADTALEGRFEVAKRAGLGEQYLYQLLTDKPMANGNSRSLGKIARGKIEKVFPDWLERQQEDPCIMEVVRLMRETSVGGRTVVLDKARDMAKEYPASGSQKAA